MPLRARALARLGGDLIEAAQGATGLAAWQREALAILAPLGFDVAMLEAKGARPSVVTSGLDEVILARIQPRWPVYTRELAPLTAVAARAGVAIDSAVLGPARERLAYFQELVRPHRGTESMIAPLRIGGRDAGGLMIGRSGHAFDSVAAEAVRALLPSLAVGMAAVVAAEHVHSEPAWPPRVTAREREVLDLVQRGLTNPEIARALGTSPNTVKNQIASLFAKLGATTRAELVAISLGAP